MSQNTLNEWPGTRYAIHPVWTIKLISFNRFLQVPSKPLISFVINKSIQKWLSSIKCYKSQRLRGATVARLTPDQKVACSNHVGVKIDFTFVNKQYFWFWKTGTWVYHHKMLYNTIRKRDVCQFLVRSGHILNVDDRHVRCRS